MIIERAILHGAGDLRMEETSFDPATLSKEEILVRTLATGFSTGTDLANYQGRSEEIPGAPGYPRAVGYSNVGVIEAIGADVQGHFAGERVFSMKPHCSAFIAGKNDLLIPLPPGVDAAEASLAYLVQLGIAAMRQVDYRAGESVLVVGLGVIGLGTAAAAKAMGAQVAVVANHESRAALARAVGAHEAYLSGEFDSRKLFSGQGADIVILTANSWSAYQLSLEAARYRGRIAILGFPGRALPAPDFNPLDAKWLYGKQLTLAGAGHIARVECASFEIRFNLRRNLEYIFQLIGAGSLRLNRLISHRVPACRMKEIYELANAHDKDLTAAVFDWQGL